MCSRAAVAATTSSEVSCLWFNLSETALILGLAAVASPMMALAFAEDRSGWANASAITTRNFA
jgi:hypothetical protein